VIILVRHGQTEVNAQGRLQGHLDAPLTELGRLQAAAVAAAVTAVRAPAIVVSSPLIRAQATAAAFETEVVIDERWIEVDYGDWDGRLLKSIPAETWDHWRSDTSFAPPEGESLLVLQKRVVAACASWAEVATEQDVVIVSHVSPIKAAVAWALGVSPEVSWRTFLGVAAICRIAVGPKGPSLHSFNERTHVSALPSTP